MSLEEHLFYFLKDNRVVENPIIDRVQVLSILNAENRTGEAVEIGVFEGEYSEQILTHWKGQRLYGIDPFWNFTWEEYRDGSNRANMESTMLKCLKRMAPFEDRFNLIRQKSVDAAKQFPDETFDLIYIDGNHSYLSVRDDLGAWWPKLRVGGLLGGHDFVMIDNPSLLCEVPKAVNEFVAEHQPMKLVTTGDTSWWTRKTPKNK
jgi:hypothetical protein